MQMRSAPEFGSSAIPLPGGGFGSFTGRPVSLDRAYGLPAVGSVIRQICNAVAMCDLDVYRANDDDGFAEKAEGTWQDVLFDNPCLDDSEFDFLSDLSSGIEGGGNSFFLKTKDKLNRVLELRPLPPDCVRVRRENGRKVFDVRFPNDSGMGGREYKGVGTDQILHIPGFRWPGLLSGISPISAYRASLDRSLALEEYAGRFFQNDASTSFALKIPGKINRVQGKQILNVWESTHGGLANAHRPGLLSNGADVVKLGISMKDAQFIESEALTTQQAAQIWNWPADLIDGGDSAATQRLSVEQLGLRVMTFSLGWRLRRIEKALIADHDLFPPKSKLCPRFTTTALIRLDATTLATTLHQQIQDGTRTRNEARAELGLGPVPGGDEFLQTPVGAAPNDTPPPDPSGTLEKPQ